MCFEWVKRGLNVCSLSLVKRRSYVKVVLILGGNGQHLMCWPCLKSLIMLNLFSCVMTKLFYVGIVQFYRTAEIDFFPPQSLYIQLASLFSVGPGKEFIMSLV